MPSDADPRPSTPARQPRPQPRLSGAALGGLFAVVVAGVAAFLLLLDVLYRQDDPVVPVFTGNLSQVAGSAVACGALALLAVAAIAILLPRQQRQVWTPGTDCPSCGAWVGRPPADGLCPSCGQPLASQG